MSDPPVRALSNRDTRGAINPDHPIQAKAKLTLKLTLNQSLSPIRAPAEPLSRLPRELLSPKPHPTSKGTGGREHLSSVLSTSLLSAKPFPLSSLSLFHFHFHFSFFTSTLQSVG